MSTTTQSQQLPGLAHPTTYQVVAEEPILPPLKYVPKVIFSLITEGAKKNQV